MTRRTHLTSQNTLMVSLRASPTVPVELKFPVELASENEFNSTGSFNSTGTVGDARRLLTVGSVDSCIFKTHQSAKNTLVTVHAQFKCDTVKTRV